MLVLTQSRDFMGVFKPGFPKSFAQVGVFVPA